MIAWRIFSATSVRDTVRSSQSAVSAWRRSSPTRFSGDTSSSKNSRSLLTSTWTAAHVSFTVHEVRGRPCLPSPARGSWPRRCDSPPSSASLFVRSRAADRAPLPPGPCQPFLHRWPDSSLLGTPWERPSPGRRRAHRHSYHICTRPPLHAPRQARAPHERGVLF